MSKMCEHEWVFNQDYDEQMRMESYTCRKCGEHQRINCEAESIEDYGGQSVYICSCGFETFNVEESLEHRRNCEIDNKIRLAQARWEESEEW